MTVDLATLGKRLAEARTNCDMTQDQAAQAVGLARTAIVHIEAGERPVTVSDLARLSELYGIETQVLFEASFKLQPDPLRVLGRMEPNLADDPQLIATIRRHVDVCKEAAAIERDLAIPDHGGPPTYRYDGPANHAEADEQGRLVAEEERRRLGLSDLPIARLTDLVAQQGIWTAKIALPDEVSGLFLFHPAAGMLIMGNSRHKCFRQRFSVAHEYAHALFDRDRQATLTSPSTSSLLIERRANAFAAAFLMPTRGVTQFLEALGKGPSRRHYTTFDPSTQTAMDTERRVPPGSQQITYHDVVLLNLHFGVSYQAACYRLKDLKLVNAAHCDQLLSRDQQRMHWTRILKIANPEPDGDEIEPDPLPRQIVPLLLEGYRRELISRGFLMDMCRKLGVSGADAADLAMAD